MVTIKRLGRTLLPLLLLNWTLLATPAAAQRPVVERLQPTSGPPGTEVNIVGRNVGRGARFFLGDVELTLVRALPYRTTVRIPEGATSGEILIQTSSGRYLGPTFRVTAARPVPMISAVEPPAGAPGSEVVLRGANFSPRLGDNVVSFAGRAVTVRSGTPTELRVIVPSDVPGNAASGTFQLQVLNVPGVAQSPSFEITSGTTITGVEPAIGAPGGELTITGTGFAPDPRQNRVYLGSRRLNVLRASGTELVVRLPARPAEGELLVDVRTGGRAVSTYEVRRGPVVRRFRPQAGPPGTTVVLEGQNFGNDVRQVQVLLGGQLVHVRRVVPDEIEAEIPANATSGALEVRVGGMIAPAGDFAVTGSLAIASFEPRRGAPGSTLTISGSGFSSLPGQNRVSVGGVRATVSSATPSRLIVAVPEGPSGPVRVQVGSSLATSAYPFVIGSGPTVSELSPPSGPAGTQVTIVGAGFGARRALVTATLNGQSLEVLSVQDDQAVVRIPPGARSGAIQLTIGTQGSTTTPYYTVEALRAVSQVSPSSGFPGTEVVIRGQGFPRDGVTVAFQGTGPIPVRRVGPAELRVGVPDGAQSGPVTVYLPGGRTIAAGEFTVSGVPEGTAITRIEPSCAFSGCEVVLRGYGFAARRAHNRVRFNGRTVRVRAATPTSLTLTLPNAPGNGRFALEVRGGGAAESPAFVILSR